MQSCTSVDLSARTVKSTKEICLHSHKFTQTECKDCLFVSDLVYRKIITHSAQTHTSALKYCICQIRMFSLDWGWHLFKDYSCKHIRLYWMYQSLPLRDKFRLTCYEKDKGFFEGFRNKVQIIFFSRSLALYLFVCCGLYAFQQQQSVSLLKDTTKDSKDTCCWVAWLGMKGVSSKSCSQACKARFCEKLVEPIFFFIIVCMFPGCRTLSW